MEIKHELFFLSDPKLSEDEKAKVKKMLEQRMVGTIQAEKGKARQEITDDFLAMFPADRIARLEEGIKRLRTIEADKKFRAEIISMLMDVYLNGMLAGDAAQEQMAALLEKHNVKIK